MANQTETRSTETLTLFVDRDYIVEPIYIAETCTVEAIGDTFCRGDDLVQTWRKSDCTTETRIMTVGGCIETCTEGPIGENFCRGDDLVQNYQRTDCETEVRVVTKDGCKKSEPPACKEGFVGDSYCKGADEYQTYQLSNCETEERIIKINGCSPDEPRTCTEEFIGDTFCRGNDLVQNYRRADCDTEVRLVKRDGCREDAFCTRGFIGDAYCRGDDLVQIYQLEDCSTEVRVTVRNGCFVEPTPPPPEPVQWRSCIDGKLYTGEVPSGYRSAPYEGTGGGICWEPTANVGVHPPLGNLEFIYRRGSGKFPESYKFTADNPSFAISYNVKILTNDRLFNIQPPEFQIRPRSKQDFTISINEITIDEFGDGRTSFDLRLEITEI
jgi:hypothetical protein